MKMTRRIKNKAFTIVEVMTIILICVFVLFVLFFILRNFRGTAYRMVCGTNLAYIGMTMMVYANDYNNEYPRAGGPTSVWARNIKDWKADNRYDAYGLAKDDSGGQGSINSSLYLLVKYAKLKPKYFICIKDKGVTEFRPAAEGEGGRDLIELWDFGSNPARHVSYAYQMVYGPYKLSASSDPDMAVLADRNPWIDSPFQKAKDFSKFKTDIEPFNRTREQARCGNSFSHKDAGQNVTFMDGSTRFESRPYCGVDNDNIYTYWDGDDKVRGKPAKFGSEPASELDSLLVNDPPVK